VACAVPVVDTAEKHFIRENLLEFSRKKLETSQKEYPGAQGNWFMKEKNLKQMISHLIPFKSIIEFPEAH